MTQQQIARDALRGTWPKIVDEQLLPALKVAHAEGAALKVLEILLGQPFDPAKYKQLDACSGELLDHCVQFEDCEKSILNGIVRAAENQLSSLPKNPHARGGKLRKLVEEEQRRQKEDVRRRYDALCVTRGSDRFADFRVTKQKVLIGLANAVRQAGLDSGDNTDETELKRRAKALAVLLDDRFTMAQRASVMDRLAQSASTASFPYVLRYLFRDTAPQLPPLPSPSDRCSDGFSDELLQSCGEAKLSREAVLRFRERRGLFGEFANVSAPLTAELQTQFKECPPYLSLPSGIFLPKKAVLTVTRADRYRLPDGIVAALGLCLVIEWTLRQIVFAKNLGEHKRPRAAVLISRLQRNDVISENTCGKLRPLFDWPALSIRDALVHGAFHGDDPVAVGRVVLAASEALKCLVDDVSTSVPSVFASARWDAESAVDQPFTMFAVQQLQRKMVLFDQISEQERAHLFDILARLTPDKRLLGQASFLFFVSNYRKGSSSKAMAGEELFSACLGLYIVLEDLFRAVLEMRGHRVLRVSPQGEGAVKYELAILDCSPGNLLAEDALVRAFGDGAPETLTAAFGAARAFRDALFHGHLSELSINGFAFAHLAAKLLFALSASVGNVSEC